MEEETEKVPEVKTLEFRYLKSSSFRVIHADGAYGGVTPHADIHMIIYSERPSIPDSVLHGVTADGQLGDTVMMEGRGGVVREVEADVVMNLITAKALLAWLSNKVQTLESALEVKEEANNHDSISV